LRFYRGISQLYQAYFNIFYTIKGKKKEEGAGEPGQLQASCSMMDDLRLANYRPFFLKA
jgi:hypothetical protein